tara:strand:+ start:432 stop:1541 length:1110 start_codon:yes stop_codon:yes gene_type:complete
MKQNEIPQKIAVIGGGIVGMTTVLKLSQLGHDVCLIDPRLNQSINFSKELNGSTASLGVLMGYIYQKSSGRSWRLRKRSMELWPELINGINTSKKYLSIKTPLIKLATSEKEKEVMKVLSKKKSIYGLEMINEKLNKQLSDALNINSCGGIISHNDGRIDPLLILENLILKLNDYCIDKIKSEVKYIERKSDSGKNKWKIILSDGKQIEKSILVICAGLGSQKLLNHLGYNIILQPIMGQAVELKVNKSNILKELPAVINIKGFNLINVDEEDKIIIGATLEKDLTPDSISFNKMLDIYKNKASWLYKDSISKKWYGLRAQPIGTPSPILKHPETGLIINTGHYRNGILLAPACAEWVGKEIEKYDLSL